MRRVLTTVVLVLLATCVAATGIGVAAPNGPPTDAPPTEVPPDNPGDSTPTPTATQESSSVSSTPTATETPTPARDSWFAGEINWSEKIGLDGFLSNLGFRDGVGIF